MTKLLNCVYSRIVYVFLLWKADGSHEFGMSIRWAFLFGEITEKQMKKVDARNFKKWKKATGKGYKDYLDVARV